MKNSTQKNLLTMIIPIITATFASVIVTFRLNNDDKNKDKN
jgi:hypothetical protein